MSGLIVFFVIFIFVMALALGVIVAAATVMSKNRKLQNEEHENYYRDEVPRPDSYASDYNTQSRVDSYFFEKSTPRTNPIEFYCDAPTLGIKIPSDNPIQLDDDEVVRYINSMLENKHQNYFGLDNKFQVIQFFNEGTGNEILIDIPDTYKNGSYQAIINGVNKTKSIVRAYYRGDDVFELADFEFMKF